MIISNSNGSVQFRVQPPTNWYRY